MLTLHVDSFFVSPYAMSAFVALEEKGAPYTLRTVSLPDKQHHQAGYGARTRRVPALQDGDFWLAESTAITEYLEDVLPPPRHPRLYPADPRERAVARELQAWLRSDLGPLRQERPTTSLFYADRRATEPLSAAARETVARLVQGVTPLLGAGQATLFSEWCLADADLGLMLQRLALNGDALPAPLRDYAAASWQRPSVRRWVERARPPYVPY